MGPTLPPKIMDNLVLVEYEGASFVFKYATKVEPSMLMTTENTLAKITMNADSKLTYDRFKRGKLLLVLNEL
jgi:hypothetical protein